MRKAFDWKRSRISMLEVEAVPQSSIPKSRLVWVLFYIWEVCWLRLIMDLQLVPRSRSRGSIHRLPHTSSRRSAQLVKHRDNFTFTSLTLDRPQSRKKAMRPFRARSVEGSDTCVCVQRRCTWHCSVRLECHVGWYTCSRVTCTDTWPVMALHVKFQEATWLVSPVCFRMSRSADGDWMPFVLICCDTFP
jgi:hypothetical protein